MSKNETLSVFPIFIPHQGCPQICLYCNQKVITQVETPDLEKLRDQLEGFVGKESDKRKEIAFFGGNFTTLPLIVRLNYYHFVEPYLSKTSGLRISTRPDALSKDIVNECKRHGVRTIEIGVQTFDDAVLGKVGRGYTSQQAIEAVQRVKKKRMTLGIQLMPGLPGANAMTFERDIRQTIECKPDFVRIYPTVVLKNTGLEAMWREGGFYPMSLDEAILMCTYALQEFEKAGIIVAKIGLHSDIPVTDIVAGPHHPILGDICRLSLLLDNIQAAGKPGQCVILSPQDAGFLRGHGGKILYQRLVQFQLDKFRIFVDKTLTKGEFLLSDQEPENADDEK